MAREAARPGGKPPPRTAFLDGEEVDLEPLAVEVAARHLVRCPGDVERYGAELVEEWCVHDMQHVLAWAFGDHAGLMSLSGNAGWLARVLDARDYPLANYWDCFHTAAEVVEERVPGGDPVAALLRGVAP